MLSEPTVRLVLERWGASKAHEAPAYSGGVLDAWPSLMADGLAICRDEETAIGDFIRWKEQHDGSEPPTPG